MNLKNKVAVITGASSGIGKATAERLASAGAAVVIHYAGGKERAEAVVQAIEAKGGTAIALRADVEQQNEVRALFEAVDKAFGSLDILVNNAGIFAAPEFTNIVDSIQLIGEISDSTIEHVIGVNLKGTIYATQEAAKRLANGGRIINISSTAYEFPAPGTSIYTATKMAVRGLTTIWAKELGARNITVNTVVPNVTKPGMRGGDEPEEYWKQAEAASPSGRVGQSEDVADVIAFLCSEDARWVSGQHTVVNGASSA